MNNLNKIISTVCALVFLIPFISGAQNNTSSPYSKFGTGDLNNIAFGRNLALGGTGFGLRDPFYLNIKNPASLTSIDSLYFLFETGVFIQNTNSANTDVEQEFIDGNLSHVTFGHRYTKWLMGAYGIMPYTSIGYNIRTEQSLESEDSKVFTDWQGTGGINKLFYNVGYKLSKNFSFGAEAAYLYGPLKETKKTWAAIQSDNPTYYNTSTRYHGFSYKGAFQYTTNIGKKGTNLTLGGTISPELKLRGKTDVIIEQQYGDAYIDSMYYYTTNATPIIMPLTYGAGFGFIWRGKYMLAADYEKAYWSVNTDKAYVDQTIYSVGLERMPRNSFNYFQRCSYRVGIRYDSGYINAKGYNIDDARFSLGVGFPIQKTGSAINVTFEAGQKGTTRIGLIRERYTKFTVAFNFQDYWFIKRKVN